MDEAPPRRKRFQIHLSTALILMLAAGGLMWANLFGRSATYDKALEYWTQEDRESEYKAFDDFGENLSKKFYYQQSRGGTVELIGFPNTMLVKCSYHATLSDESRMQGHWYSPIYWGALAANVSVALGILFTIWFVCEWWIRRRAAKRGI